MLQFLFVFVLVSEDFLGGGFDAEIAAARILAEAHSFCLFHVACAGWYSAARMTTQIVPQGSITIPQCTPNKTLNHKPYMLRPANPFAFSARLLLVGSYLIHTWVRNAASCNDVVPRFGMSTSAQGS